MEANVTTMTYSPATVSVSDDRRTVPGATIRIGDATDDVIPPEGPSPDAWMGETLHMRPEGVDDDVWMAACAEAAEAGARGERGTIELRAPR